MNNPRQITRLIKGSPTSDGAGVDLTRIIGTAELDMLDPFLMLDQFGSDQAQDYIAGFPPHPHRGFETVSYILNGRIRHKDSVGNQGIIEAGGVQWMTAGRGVVHSEMPEQDTGLLSGFQLWINLPAAHKMDAPAYQEFAADQIPVERHDNGTEIKVIAGRTQRGLQGPIIQPLTDPLYLDISLPTGKQYAIDIPEGHNAFIYSIKGSAVIGEKWVAKGQLGVLSQEGQMLVSASEKDTRFLLIAGKPIGEPVARGGPFVMNTDAEIQQAFADYKSGILS